MQTKVDLNSPFSYNVLPLIIVFLIILLLIIISLILYFKKKSKKKVVIPKDIFSIKNNYVNKLNKLENDFNNNKISSRKAYQKLSILIRSFVYEAFNINVKNNTLTDIKKLGIKPLERLIEMYYSPEFSYSFEGDFKDAIKKTKKELESWK